MSSSPPDIPTPAILPVHRRSALVVIPPQPRPPRRLRARSIGFWSTFVVAPTLTYLALRRVGKPRAGIAAAAGVVLGLGLARTQLARLFSPEPPFRRLSRRSALDLRDYEQQIHAVTTLDANFETALDRGFSRLFDYISGDNASREHVSMTAPVLTSTNGAGGYEIAFVMPAGRTLASLPSPTNATVSLRVVPARRVTVLPFSGRFTRDNIVAHADTLERLALAAGLTLIGVPTFAGYDAPMTLPPLRRNEMWAIVAR